MKCPKDGKETIACTIYYCPECKSVFTNDSKIKNYIKKELDKVRGSKKVKSLKRKGR